MPLTPDQVGKIGRLQILRKENRPVHDHRLSSFETVFDDEQRTGLVLIKVDRDTVKPHAPVLFSQLDEGHPVVAIVEHRVRGMASAFRWSTEIRTVAYISGRRSLSGLSNVHRTFAVRVFGSRDPLTQSTLPLYTLLG